MNRNTRRCGLVISVAMASPLLRATLAEAQSTVDLAALERCASIEADAARLACFDAVTRIARGVPGESEPGRETGSNSSAGSGNDASSSSPGIDAFGSELVEERGFEIPDEIQSRLVGEFTGWRGNTVFRLENGQVWRQAERARLVFEADSPLVTVRRGSFGSYRLSVEGVNSSVRVRRVE